MFITGWTDKDGNSLSYEPLGMFVNDEDTQWGNRPYNKEQWKVYNEHERFLKCFNKVTKHLDRTNRTILKEMELIKTNKSTLPRYCKDWLIKAKD
tara:strand:- start:8355 stop:8639 length:285 start_codon:yes stop_codon:yes gene_type:complete